MATVHEATIRRQDNGNGNVGLEDSFRVECDGATRWKRVRAEPRILVEFLNVVDLDGSDGKVASETPQSFRVPDGATA
jgi:hypothetical protein